MWASATLGHPNKATILGHYFCIIRAKISGDILAIGFHLYLQVQEIWTG